MTVSSHLCIRSLDVSQASPFLEMAWNKIKAESPSSDLVLLDQPSAAFSSIIGAKNIVPAKDGHQSKVYNSLVSWSIPNERTLEDIIMSPEVYTTPGPLNAVYKLSDKRATKMLFEKFSLLTPSWEILDRGFTQGNLLRDSTKDNLERNLLNCLSFPLVVKTLWDCMGHGVEIIRDQHLLTARLTEDNKNNLLIESFIDGALGSIEIIGTPESYFFQPPCLTGQSGNGVVSNFDTIRICHPHLFHNLLTQKIKNKLVELLKHLGFQGACCVDFIATHDSLYFLEINPRISGISCLSSAASGLNSFEATYLISANKWPRKEKIAPSNDGAAVQIGGSYADKHLSTLREMHPIITIYRNNTISVDGNQSHNIIAGGDYSVIHQFLLKIGFPNINSLLDFKK